MMTQFTASQAATDFRTTTIDGVNVFYREAGDPSKPTIVLLHGFPSSSHQFHDLIPRLADRFHVIAPDYPGMGFSEAPAPTVLRPTFDDVTTVIDAFIAQRAAGPLILYLHDIGGPIGMRIATARPERIAGLIFQNFTISVEGWNPERLKVYERIGGPETPESQSRLLIRGSPLPVLGKNVVSRLRSRVARGPALGVVPLRRRASCGAGLESIGRGVVIEHGISPSAAVREPLAVLLHEVHVQQVARHRRLCKERVRLRFPVDLRHLGSVRNRLTVAGNAGAVRVDHHGIAEDHRDHPLAPTDGDRLPCFVSPELGKREPARHLHRVLVLRGNGETA